MPCQEWMEFQPSRSSAEKTQEAERASYLSLGDLYPCFCLHSQGRSYKKYPKEVPQYRVELKLTPRQLHILSPLRWAKRLIKKKKKKKTKQNKTKNPAHSTLLVGILRPEVVK